MLEITGIVLATVAAAAALYGAVRLGTVVRRYFQHQATQHPIRDIQSSPRQLPIEAPRKVIPVAVIAEEAARQAATPAQRTSRSSRRPPTCSNTLRGQDP